MNIIHTEKILLGGNKRIRLRFHPSPGIISEIKKIPDLRWSPTLKAWHLPDNGNHIAYLNDLFRNRIRYVERSGYPDGTKKKDRSILCQDVPEEDRIYLKFAYHRDIVDLIKTFESPYWHKDLKLWSIKGGKENYLEMVHALMSRDLNPESAEIYDKRTREARIDSRQESSLSIPEKFMKYMDLKNYSYRTMEAYEHHISRFIASFPEEKILTLHADQINEYIHKLVEDFNYSRSYQNQLINAIKLFYKVMNGKTLETNSIPRPKRSNKLPIVLSKDEISTILRTIKNIKHRTIITVIYGTGIRLSESANLRINDIDYERKLVHIRGGKGRKDRIVPLSPLLHEKLYEYIRLYKPKEYLFEGISGGPYSTRSIQAILKTALANTGITKNASIHSLRHSFATHTLEQGTDIRLLQEILGHSSIKTTEIYTHISNTSILRVKSPLDKLDL